MPSEKPNRTPYFNAYTKAHYTQISVRVPPSEADEIKRRAALANKSLARFIVDRCLSPDPEKEDG